jgi:hypothetical protein
MAKTVVEVTTLKLIPAEPSFYVCIVHGNVLRGMQEVR